MDEFRELASCVVKLLKQNNKTLAAAESMTGGLFAELITSVPGASNVFWGSMVTYGDGSKQKILGVDNNIILEKTEVSKEVARAMAEALAKLSGCDICVSVTGLAGPKSDYDKGNPVGLFYIGLSYLGICEVFEYSLGDLGRETLRSAAAYEMLELIFGILE